MLDQKKIILAHWINSPFWMFACAKNCGQFLCYPKYNTWVKDSRAVGFFKSIAVLVGRELVQGRNGNEFKVHSKTSYQYGRLEQNPSRRPWKLYKTYPSDLTYRLRAQWSMWKRREEGCKSPRWSVIPQKPHFADTTGLVHIWTLRECDSIHKTCTSSKQINSSMEMKKSTPSLTLRTYLQLITIGRRTVRVFFTVGWQPHSRECSEIVGQ